MNINTVTTDGVTTVTLEGMLDSTSASKFQEAVSALLEKENMNLVFDMGGLEYTSSQGIRTFLTLLKTAAVRGGKLVFRNIRPAVKEVFDMSGLSQLMTIE